MMRYRFVARPDSARPAGGDLPAIRPETAPEGRHGPRRERA